MRKPLQTDKELQTATADFILEYYLRDIAKSLRILTRDKEMKLSDEKIDNEWLESLDQD